MECAFLSRNDEEAKRLFDFVLDRTRSAMDKATLINFMQIMYAGAGQHQAAVRMGMEALKLLGKSFPLKAGRYEVTVKFLWLRFKLCKRRVQSLSALPEITNPRQRLIMKLLLDMAFSIYLLDPDLFILLTIKIFDLTLKYGNSPAACLGYASYGAYVCAGMEDYSLGTDLGELALAMSEKLERPHPTKILLWYGSGISFWRHHIRAGLAHSRTGFQRAVESGDYLFAGYHMLSIASFLFFSGTRLEEVTAEIDTNFEFMQQSKDAGTVNALISMRQIIRCLRGETKSHLSIDDASFSEADHIQQIMEQNPQTVLMRHYLLKLQLLYLMGDYQGAMEMAQRSARLIRFSAGTIFITEFYFYRCLTMLALLPQASAQKKRKYRKSIRRYIRRFLRMAKSCAPNFKHMFLILLAEKAQLNGQYDKAFGCFKDAVNLAEEHGYVQIAALANELSAKLALNQGLHTLAKVFLQEANAGYLRWGAVAKSQLLVRTHPNFLPSAQTGPMPASRQIDYATVVNALQAISTEIVLDRLLKKLMKIVVENAGAQRVLFILKQGDELAVKASSNVGGPIRLTNQNMPVQSRDDLLLAGIHYVHHTQNPVIIEDVQLNSDYRGDPYVIQYKPKSIVCLPVMRQADLVAILYLENNIVAGAFTPDRIEILQLIASQAAISIENARLYENVMQKERDLLELSEKLRSLSSELLLTEERERRRIAVDLHDRIGHALANVKMQLGVLKQTADNPQALDPMNRIGQLIDQSIQDTQSLTFDLSPPVLYDLGLEAAIEWLVDQTQEQHRLSVSFQDDQQPKPIDESIRVLAFQAARELLFNIVKHAQAHHVWVTMKRVGDMAHITIEDDGIGLQASMQRHKTTKKGGGFGLFSIQERLKHFGGRLEMTSDPGKGTRMELIVPMQTTQGDRV
jgi:signal transduction histidine kinase